LSFGASFGGIVLADADIEIVTTERVLTAVARGEAAMPDVPSTVRSLMSKAYAEVLWLDVGRLGHNIALYRMRPDGRLDIEAGVEIQRSFKPGGALAPSELPAGRAIRLRHIGPYDGIAAAYATGIAWAGQKNLKLAGVNWDVYSDWNADPAKLETSIHLLLA
jgi:hypothetical protein